jgi:hypothetical protein
MDQNDIPYLKVYVAKTLSWFEMWFPLGFFDIMTHLFIRLVDGLDICGPVVTRWCYPVERYLGVLKQYVWNKAKLEGCMAMGTCMMKLWD